MQVKIKDGVYVNPKYVTCIEPYEKSSYGTQYNSQLWVVAHSGYGTKSHNLMQTPEEVAKILNDAEGKFPGSVK